jgi:hypothetical protein
MKFRDVFFFCSMVELDTTSSFDQPFSKITCEFVFKNVKLQILTSAKKGRRVNALAESVRIPGVAMSVPVVATCCTLKIMIHA